MKPTDDDLAYFDVMDEELDGMKFYDPPPAPPLAKELPWSPTREALLRALQESVALEQAGMAWTANNTKGNMPYTAAKHPNFG